MNQESIILLNEAVDGTLDPTRRPELERLLREDPEAAAFYRDLDRIAGAVRTMPAVGVPAHFTRGVMDRLPARPEPALSRRHDFATLLRSLWSPRLALAFAAGCLATFIVTGGIDPVSTGEVSGTMAQPGASHHALPGGMGRVTVVEERDAYVVGIEIARPDPAARASEIVVSVASGDSVLYEGRF